jgi:hypothetical protein
MDKFENAQDLIGAINATISIPGITMKSLYY